jgi:hypothetical protein
MQARHFATLAIFVLLITACAFTQDNYEIQVYPSELVPPRTTMVEIHSNFTVNGSKQVVEGVQPTHHAMHETLEITQGFTDWVQDRLLRVDEHSAGWRLAVGGRSYSAAHRDSAKVALASRT